MTVGMEFHVPAAKRRGQMSAHRKQMEVVEKALF
jgi:hypothetical protein